MRCPAPAPIDLRAVVRAAMIRVHGREEGAQAALAARMAMRWGIAPDSAVRKLSRFLTGAHGGDMTSDALAPLLHELGLTVAPAEQPSSL